MLLKKTTEEVHPLDPLSPSEISSVAEVLRATFPANQVIFRVITLAEPPKALLVPYLSAERANLPRPVVPRKAFCQYYLDDRQQFRQLEIDLATKELSAREALPGKHSYTDAEEGVRAEAACLADLKVQDAIKQLDLPEKCRCCGGAVDVCTGWAGGYVAAHHYGKIEILLPRSSVWSACVRDVMNERNAD
ncbi:Copper amine oxidase [Lachnellula subtilissima]|uniref:Amine oxidase n=1 Tax=Lachnellula subtilissima TaxID=602034 RepID=A0A8H8S1U0_9HELO|nr:Copper amine oxidase [Lachnellula subtilissima]